MAKNESPGFQILRAIRRILRRTSEHSRTVGRAGGVSVPQMLCLRAIADLSDNDEVTVAQVASSVHLSAATVSRILDRLEKSSFVLRERRSNDRRKVCLSLTETGRKRLQALPAPLHEQFLKRLDALPTDERQELLRALEKIVELMDATGLDASPVLISDLEVSPDREREPSDRQ